MWSSRKVLQSGVLALAIAGASALAGCSGFTPVYGEHGLGSEQHPFRYAEPANRLEQIIYQELVLRLGRTADAAVPTVKVTATSFVRSLTMTNVNRPAEQREAVVNATIEIVGADGSVVYSASRSASALYTTDSQSLAATEAEREAKERAAKELAETVRLTILGALARPAA